MRYGYARVSTGEQTAEVQADALRTAGCESVVVEVASGGGDRPRLRELLEELGEGDVLVVWKLDRLTRSLSDLLAILDRMEQRGARFRSLTEGLETETATGRMVASVLGAFAEFERALISERTLAGLARAKRQGSVFGRPRALTEQQRLEVVRRVEGGEWSTKHAARVLGVSKSTIRRAVRRAAKEQAS